jgi:hypothetical protein
MIQKKKICSNCNLESYIWTNRGGKKLCKKCSTTGVDMKKPTTKAKPIAPRSQKRSKEERLYSAKRVLFLLDFPMCQANIQGVCKGQASEVHHKKGRIGNDLLDETNWLALCHNCHEYVERERTWAMEKGYSIKRIT